MWGQAPLFNFRYQIYGCFRERRDLSFGAGYSIIVALPYNESMIYLGADHRGFQLKEELKKYLSDNGLEMEDIGAFEYDKDDDYPDFASLAAEKVSANPANDKAIVICGSGHGVDMVANKFRNVRAALCFNRQIAAQSREHEDANVLVLASDWLSLEEAKDIINVWLASNFDGADRNIRRLRKIQEIEGKNFQL